MNDFKFWSSESEAREEIKALVQLLADLLQKGIDTTAPGDLMVLYGIRGIISDLNRLRKQYKS